MYIKCHKCGNFEPEASAIILKGYCHRKGGILLPVNMHEYHFCSVECFETWI